MKITLNLSSLNNHLSEAFRNTCERLGDKMTEVIEREGGYSPPFPPGRDIVDTGALRDSQSIVFKTRFYAQFGFPVDYAIYVHEGCTLKNGKRQPGRPWTFDSVDELDLEKTFIEELGKVAD